MNQKGSAQFILVIAILIPVLFLSMGYLFGSRIPEKQKKQEKQGRIDLRSQNPAVNKRCEYNILDKASYLPSYVVKRGDTLLQISNNYLGGTDRISEIVTLNEQTYNTLHFNYSLEVGWLLYLPPKFAFPSSGNIWAYSGEILSESDNLWEFTTVNKEGNPLNFKIYKNPQTKVFGKSEFHPKDCVRIIIDGKDYRVIAISMQDELINYFRP